MAQLLPILIIAAIIFGICYLVDKAFSKLFRSKAQHRSGKAVRVNKRYGVFGVVLTVLGIMAVCIGITDGPVLLWGGVIVLLMGIAMAVYYLSFGFSTTARPSCCSVSASRMSPIIIRILWVRSCI